MKRRHQLASLLALGVVVLCGSGLLSAAEKQSRLEQVNSLIEAGEFGNAWDLAKAAPTGDERETLFQSIATAQLAAGEARGARATGRVAQAQERARTRNQQTAGGGSGADFGPLIDLIIQNTGGEGVGPWESEDGEGAPDPQPHENGVRVDPNGLLRNASKTEVSGRLSLLGTLSRSAALNEDMARASNLRMVSLTRLEKAVAERISQGESVPTSMRYLAGLSKIQYVFVYPEDGEIVVAGPAEPWRFNDQGIPVGESSGRPCLQLDDLVVVLRTFDPTGKRIFGCSIDPRPEQLKEVKSYVDASQAKGPLAPGQLPVWAKEIEKRMGDQDVVIYGVPTDSRVANVLVAADYRMKLIGIEKIDGGPSIPSIFDLLPTVKDKALPLNALRWWLTMKYDSILHSPERDAYELVGSSVQVLSEDQFVTATGERVQTGKSSLVNELFAKNFTNSYEKLAKKDPIFADLQNIFDLGMVAALCHTEGLAARVDWNLGVFAPNGAYEVVQHPEIKTANSVMNFRKYAGGEVVVQVAGGVRGDLVKVAQDEVKNRENPELAKVNARAKAPKLPSNRWWWDAESK